MKCSHETCQNEAKEGKKYCPACAKVARGVMMDLFKAKKEEKEKNEAEFSRVLELAYAAGNKAHQECETTPMVVVEGNKVVEVVQGGVCGFAWVAVSPCNSKFANWLQKAGYRADEYSKNIKLRPMFPTQSMARKEAWARAVSEVLNQNVETLKAGGKSELRIYANSRID